MKRMTACVTAAVALVVVVALVTVTAVAQEKPRLTKEALQGTWSYTSAVVERPDGTKFEVWGPDPNGRATFMADGFYTLVVSRRDLPKFASKDRLKGTPEENQAVVRGALAHFGRYAVNETNGTFTLHVENSSFPNDVGTDQKRIAISLNADELKFTNPSPTTGSSATVTWRRLK
jgi:hypothetical protein